MTKFIDRLIDGWMGSWTELDCCTLQVFIIEYVTCGRYQSGRVIFSSVPIISFFFSSVFYSMVLFHELNVRFKIYVAGYPGVLMRFSGTHSQAGERGEMGWTLERRAWPEKKRKSIFVRCLDKPYI